MRIPLLLTVAGATLIAGCRPAPFDPDDPTTIAVIDSLVESAMDGARSANADQVLAFAADDLTFLTGDALFTGLEGIRARFKDTYSAIRSQRQTVLEKRIRLLSPDVAVVTTVAEGTYTDNAGWTSDPVGIGTTIVLVRDHGTWRAEHAHQSIAY